MVSTSLKPSTQLFVYPPVWLPEPFEWSNYYKAVTTVPFFAYLQNTVIVACCATLGVVISCPLAGYSFARLQWRGRDTLFLVTLAVLMVPSQVTMVSLFIIFSKLNLVGTFYPLILPSFFGAPFFIFLMRQFFKQLPKSLEDAARIDGCSEIRIYTRVMLPLCQPAILTIALFQFMHSWNDFVGPLIYLSDERLYTLQLGLQQFKQAYHTEWSQLMAASVLVAVPIIVFYFFVQRSFIQGITFGGIKG
ncbi:carbohydrate ABC transporter permease [Paenibacillus piri]|uniref:Carbohydrate ABC transporter permease n=2 Tax=Paenibacillus piri TaxID=2547395 RepID=A0A4R5KNP9_9BACL|nr:carbohydrate ABC transporter permease [Paenibacillus piri]